MSREIPTHAKLFASRALQPRILHSEDAISDAIAQQALLIEAHVRASRKLGLAAEVAHSPLVKAHSALNDLLRGLSKTIEAHKDYVILMDELGPWPDFGSGPVKSRDSSPEVVSADEGAASARIIDTEQALAGQA